MIMTWSTSDERAARDAAAEFCACCDFGCKTVARAYTAIRTATLAGRAQVKAAANCGDCFAAGFMAGEEAMRERAAEVCPERSPYQASIRALPLTGEDKP